MTILAVTGSEIIKFVYIAILSICIVPHQNYATETTARIIIEWGYYFSL